MNLIDDRQLAPTSVAGTVAALRFLYQVLKRDWAVEALPLPKRGETLQCRRRARPTRHPTIAITTKRSPKSRYARVRAAATNT